ncbi:CAAX protease [Campylobacter taeniopygiae]|uniref:CAAX protease n=1 Tax=Campylobacter taeniopygiae TaxID=2510188 RepID=A0ABY2TKM5_9BACT|nr:CAAX protease [Campylobacter taeniopygiae]TKX34423.1 CAAX protease [Campylobacter taeniopygiae]
MGFSLQSFEYEKIKILFSKFPNLLNEDFEARMKKAIGVLHFDYLWGACKEAEKILPKCKQDNLFDLIMKLYTKKRKTHQANFLLLHCFENALRSTLCVKIANLYNTSNNDSWFKAINSNSNGLNNILKLFNKRKKHLGGKEAQNSWEVFDCFYLVDLEDIISFHWGEFAPIFKNEKRYKGQDLPSYGTKDHLLTKLSQIRKARNEIFHNKPTKIKFRKDLEILLLRLEYNLEDAIEIGDIKESIDLRYNYKDVG